jgi:hypothetical protein
MEIMIVYNMKRWKVLGLKQKREINAAHRSYVSFGPKRAWTALIG